MAQDIQARLRQVHSASPKDESPVRALFEHFDLDGSGAISVGELRQVLAAWGEALSEHEAELLVRAVDANDDGEIDFEEFRGFILDLSAFGHAASARGFQRAYEKLSGVMNEALGIEASGARPAVPKVLLRHNINPCVRQMRYEVRGELPMRAQRIAQELAMGVEHPFDEVLFCNIGNPHSVGGKPISFYREVLALCDCPSLLDHPEVERLFAPDAVARARSLVADLPGGTGAYSHSQGSLRVRRDVAAFIQRRDGHAAHPDDLFLTNGASSGITMVMQLLVSSPNDAVLVPIPQYPIYTALIQMLDAKAVGYHLEEAACWSLREAELERALGEARARGLDPRAMVVINPGNPTGQTFDRAAVETILRFCHRNRLVLLADEVYQTNVYGDRGFVSCKQVLRELGPDYEGFELFSFHSTSKGLIGECGRRGGYMELCGIDPEVRAQLFKLACVGLCPNLDGQLMTHLMVCPPRPGDASYETFVAERAAIYAGLCRKSTRVVEALNALEGVSCQPVQGAMYVFPSLSLPPAAISAAEADGRTPDMHYCLSLLERAGICVVPGSGFGQAPATFHLRMTFLPGEARLVAALERFREHHEWYLQRYG